jgi:hypothetical protein
MLTLVAVWVLVAGANRTPDTVTEAGPLPSPVLRALSPDFLLGDLLDARAVAQKNATRQAKARNQARNHPRFVLPFPSEAQHQSVTQQSQPRSVGSTGTRTTTARETTRTKARTSTGSSKRPPAPTTSSGPGRSAQAPGKAKGHAKANGHARAAKRSAAGHR